MSQLLANSDVEGKHLWYDFPGTGYLGQTEFKEAMKKYRTGKALLEDKYHRHPGRTANYSVAARPTPARSGVHANANNTDWLYLASIRHASTVSTRFRQELGDVFWSSTRIRAEDFNSILWVTSLLRDRPTIHKGIKMASLKLDLSGDWWYEYLHEFSECCDVLATLPSLQRIQLYISVQEQDLSAVARGKGHYGYLAASRKLKVEQGCDIRLCMWLTNMERLSAFDIVERTRVLERKYSDVIGDILTPECLRIAKPTTEMSEYLSSRPRQ